MNTTIHDKQLLPTIAPTIAVDRLPTDLATMAILGVGTATPEHFFTQADAAEMADVFCGTEDERRTRLLKKLYRRATVEKRHSVLLESSSNGEIAKQSFYDKATSETDGGPSVSVRMQAYEEHATALASEAATRALKDARVKPAEVTHLVTVSCSGFAAPGADVQIIQRLGLPATTQRTNVGFMGCHGAINGMRVARGLTAADPSARVLLCAVELCTIHQQYGWDPTQTAANALFADGAAALVGIQSRAVSVTEIAEVAKAGGAVDRPWKVVGGGSAIIPNTTDLMSWRIGDHGFRMTLSRKVPDVIKSQLGDWLHPWLDSFGLTVADVGCWAAHPGGPKILDATAAGASIGADEVRVSKDILANYGNMSSATVLFVLEQLRKQKAALPCVVLGFGPGLAIEAALIA